MAGVLRSLNRFSFRAVKGNDTGVIGIALNWNFADEFSHFHSVCELPGEVVVESDLALIVNSGYAGDDLQIVKPLCNFKTQLHFKYNNNFIQTIRQSRKSIEINTKLILPINYAIIIQFMLIGRPIWSCLPWKEPQRWSLRSSRTASNSWLRTCARFRSTTDTKASVYKANSKLSSYCFHSICTNRCCRTDGSPRF